MPVRGALSRATKFSKANQDAILEALRDGNSRNASFGAIGISRQTVTRWTDPKDPYYKPEFTAAIERAEHEAEVRFVRILSKAADADWRAAESWLKRRRREDYGDNWTPHIDAEVAATLRELAAISQANLPKSDQGGTASSQGSTGQGDSADTASEAPRVDAGRPVDTDEVGFAREVRAQPDTE